MAMQPSAPQMTPFFAAYPVKRNDETQEEYAIRVKNFLQVLRQENVVPDKIQAWENDLKKEGKIFKMPEDRDELAAYLEKNRDAKLTLFAGSKEGMENEMRFLKKLGRLNNLVDVQDINNVMKVNSKTPVQDWVKNWQDIKDQVRRAPTNWPPKPSPSGSNNPF